MLIEAMVSAPTMTRLPDGTLEWRLDGQLHREDGPALVTSDGTQLWFRHGVAHREDGPAAVWADGSMA